MSTTHPITLPENESAGRTMVMSFPNPRRSPPRSFDRAILNDGRKRQKLSHSPTVSPNLKRPQTIGDEMPLKPRKSGILASQDSSSSDQSAANWYKSAANNATSATQQNDEIDGLFFHIFAGETQR